jgi:diacylglycerol kinase (ATP)
MSMKNRPFRARLGFSLAGLRIVWTREKSFRTQCGLAVLALAVTAALRPDWIWIALVTLSIALVLLLEMVNAALEYLMDRVHPDYSDEIKFAKDAAAGAVLLASLASLAVGACMVMSALFPD